MKTIIGLTVAVSCVLGQSAIASCITNNTDGPLVVGQYSLVSDEDVFRIEPVKRLCRTHSGLFNKYDVTLIPYENNSNVYRFFLKGDKDELYVTGHCTSTGEAQCRKQLTFGRGQPVTTQHAELHVDK